MPLPSFRSVRVTAVVAFASAFATQFSTIPASAEGRTNHTIGPACGFFHGQAYRRGIQHFATEMLWACETIAQRRASRMPLGARLEEADVALHRYRDAVISAGRTAFAETRTSDAAPRIHGLSDDAKRRLAEEAGALTSLEAIRNGF